MENNNLRSQYYAFHCLGLFLIDLRHCKGHTSCIISDDFSSDLDEQYVRIRLFSVDLFQFLMEHAIGLRDYI